MKKLIKSVFAIVSVASLFAFASCNDAVVNDGTNVKSYVSSKGGAGGAVPFHMYNNIMDLQIWTTDENGQPNGGGATVVPVDGAFEITQTGTWWGMAICSDAAGNDGTASAKIYDMSEVAKVTFYAKSDNAKSIWLSGCDNKNKTSVDITGEYPEEPYEVKFETKVTGTHFAIVYIGGESADGVWYIKDIAFFDASGNEIVPTVKK